MAVKTNITINIVEPGSNVPVPDTGLFTHGIGGVEASIIATVGIIIVIAIAAIILCLRKKKINLKPSKHTSIILSILAVITSIATFTGLTFNSIYNHTNAKEGDLTVTTEDTNLTIEVGDEPVFAVLPVQVTVEEATQAGYTLTAYTDSTDLVSTTNPNNKIPMVTVNEDELAALTDNTWGLALDNEPTSKDNKVYTALSTDQTNPTIIKTIDDYSETEANDTTTIYYGFYITPDVPYGTYTGSTISYEAIPNLATISYNANGLYYNNDESFTTNTVGYKPSTPDSLIEELAGEYLTPAPLNSDSSSSPIHYTFLGWSETEGATTPTYTNEEDILANLTLTKNESLTLYAVWHYDTVLSFNGTTSDGGEAIEQQTIVAGTAITLPHNTYTRTGSVFTGWNTVETPTPDNPGESYVDEAGFTAPDSSADITLYAQWAYYTTITFNGNGETSGYMSPQDIIAGTPENLVPNAFTKTNHTFIGWNTQANGSGTSYSDEAEFIASTTQHEDITLYAQWAATTISFNGNTSESGTMNPITIAGGTSTTLPQNAYTKSHCTFASWNTNPDGTGTRYPGEASYTASMDSIYSFTLYAQWQCESMINFNGNGATSGYMPGIMATGGQQTTLPQNTFTKDGYSFNGWNTSADGTGESYSDQGTYIAPVSESQNITLYAQWLNTTTISFNGNGSTSGNMDSITIIENTSQNLPQNTFTKTNASFIGWNTEPNGIGESYNNEALYTVTHTSSQFITLYAQWASTAITFNGNGSTSGSMDNFTIAAGSTSTLPQNTFTRTNYIFDGWNTAQDGMGVSYDDQADFTAISGASQNITLYAQWMEPPIMQDVAKWNNTLDVHDTIQVIDKRDNKMYYVTKMADGNIWMTQNLDLELNVNKTLTPDDTNITQNWTPGKDTINFDGSSVSGWVEDSYSPYSANPGELYIYDTGNAKKVETYTSLADCQAVHSECSAHNHAGNYYNWSAAVATNDTNIGELTTNNNNAPGSICPAGWSLPMANDSNNNSSSHEFNDMLAREGIIYGTKPTEGQRYATGNFSNILESPFWLIRFNSIYAGNLSFDNYPSGDYWSSTISTNNNAYFLLFDNYLINPGNGLNHKKAGRPIRCVAKQRYFKQISFDGNGSESGNMSGISVLTGNAVPLPANAYSKENYSFIGWNTVSDPTIDNPGITYADEDVYTMSITAPDEIVLYAQWGTTTITFDRNGGDGGVDMDAINIGAGNTFTLPANTYTKSGYYAFDSWNTKPDGTGVSYRDKDDFTAAKDISEDITLYAQWIPINIIVFNGNGSTSGSMDDQIISNGSTISLSPYNYAKDDCPFVSWNTKPDGSGIKYSNMAYFTAPETSGTIILYAQWGLPADRLYNKVTLLAKKTDGIPRTQTLVDMQAEITSPTTTDPATDSSNSGVYKYDSDTFGMPSDASNEYDVYYYRGILEPISDQGSSGYNGKATTYPNYVRLSNNTCWRIIRTTGSGGTKMIYSGLWENSTCTNWPIALQDSSGETINTHFSDKSGQHGGPKIGGYTRNGVYDRPSSSNVQDVFGDSENMFIVNKERSDIKTYIEDTWYAENMTNYTAKLESMAGYCNDRTIYDKYNNQLDTIDEIKYYGSYIRNNISGNTASLNCPRGDVDNYRYVENSAGIGNELKYPAALITADEMSFAGNGAGSNFASNYAKKSYLSAFYGYDYLSWTMSPWMYGVWYDGEKTVYMAAVNSAERLASDSLPYGKTIRPVISFNHDTVVSSGSGTATDPWVINE